MAKANIPKFDFLDLVKVFGEVLPDYFKETSLESPTLSRKFAETVIFEYGPESKSIKKNGEDHSWKYEVSVGTKMVTIHVATTFFDKKPPQHPVFAEDKIKLTFKQASLLAVHKYCQVVPLLLATNEVKLTPLAGTVFQKESLILILRDLQAFQRVSITMPQLITAIICSCQTDGFHLPLSVCHIAIVAIVCSVRQEALRESIIKNTIRRFAKRGKRFDDTKFQIYMRHANQQADINRLIANLNLGTSPCDGSDVIHTESSTTSIETMGSSDDSSSSSDSENDSKKKDFSENTSSTDKQVNPKKTPHFSERKNVDKQGKPVYGNANFNKKSGESYGRFGNNRGFNKRFDRDSSQGSAYSVKTERSFTNARYGFTGKAAHKASGSKSVNNLNSFRESSQSKASQYYTTVSQNQDLPTTMGSKKQSKRDISQSSSYSERVNSPKSRDGSRYMRQINNNRQTVPNGSSQHTSHSIKSLTYAHQNKCQSRNENRSSRDRLEQNRKNPQKSNDEKHELAGDSTANQNKAKDVLGNVSENSDSSPKFAYINDEYVPIEQDDEPNPLLKMLGEMGLIKERKQT